HEFLLILLERAVVEVWRVAGHSSLPFLGQLDELQAARYDLSFPWADLRGVLDRVLDVNERTRFFGRVGIGHEDGSLFQERPVALEDHVDAGVEKWVAGREQLCLYLARRGDELLLEGHARVAV